MMGFQEHVSSWHRWGAQIQRAIGVFTGFQKQIMCIDPEWVAIKELGPFIPGKITESRGEADRTELFPPLQTQASNDKSKNRYV